VFSRNVKGSAAHLEDILCQIGNLLEQKSVPSAASLTQAGNSSSNTSAAASFGAKNKSIESEKNLVSVSQPEWIALQKRVEELELWKERKSQEDEAFHKKIRDLNDKMTAIQLNSRHSAVAAVAPVPASVKNGSKNIFVKIAVSGSSEIHEFPTDENGNLQVESVVAVYQGNNFAINSL
jgi:hypothetical protein